MMARRMATLLGSVALGLCLMGTSGCFFTSIGMDQPAVRAQNDFGPSETLRVCGLLDDGITPADAQETLEDYWNQTEASKYNLSVKLVSYSSMPRSLSDFFEWQIGRKLIAKQIPPGCDRMMYFVNRNVLDTLWSVPEAYGAPEVLGEVDDYTMTRGYVVDRIASLNQVLMGLWLSPSKVARHETFHFLGCGHDLVMDGCYKHIAEAKWLENRLSEAGCYQKSGVGEFFPAFSKEGDGPILLTRAQANGVLGLEKDASFQSFVNCARYAGFPVDDHGVMQQAWAEDWMGKAIEEAHREAAKPVVASASPIGTTATNGGVTTVSSEQPPPAPAAAQTATAPDKQAVPGPTASLSTIATKVAALDPAAVKPPL